MDTSGFVTSLITSFLIFLFLLILTSWLSRQPSNSVIYYPSKLLKNLPIPSPGLFSSISEAWSSSEERIIQHAGLDAAVYIIFLNSALWICLYTAVFCLPVLLPVSGTDEDLHLQYLKNNTNTYSKFDLIAMGNVQKGSPRLWAFVIGAYWLTIATLYVLWTTYRHVLRLRAQDQASPKAKPEQFAVLVRDIPPATSGAMTDEVDAFFKKCHPGTYERCLIVTNIDKVSKIWKELESSKRKKAHAEAVMELTKKRPTHKTGTLGLCGETVDSIEFYTEQIGKLTVAWKESQRETWAKEQQGAAIVFFNNRRVATCVAQAMHGEYANIWTVSPAPEPREIVWGNLPIPFVPRLVRQFAVYGIVFLTIVFYMIPISFVSAIISLDSLEKKLPFLKPIVTIKPVNTILQAYLPQLALIIFLALLPALLLKLSQIEGIPAQSHVVRAAAGKYFYFNVFNVFLGVTIAGTLFTSLSGLIDNPTSIVSLLSNSLPKQVDFFISFVALQFFVGYGLAVCRIVPLIIYRLKLKFLCKTEEEIQEAWAPGSFSYATCVPADMLVITITLCYAVIAPMILPFAIVYFALGWLISRNQALNVVVPSFESGGRMWPHMHSRILAALFVSQLTMLGYYGIKKFPYTPLMVPLPIITLIFAYICRKFYYPSFNSSPLVSVCEDVKDEPSIDAIVEAYTPTCLLSKDRIEDPEKLDE